MARPDTGKTGKKRASVRTRTAKKVKEEAASKAPGPANPQSPLAVWLLNPSPTTRSRLEIESGFGRLTKADLQSAITAQLILEAEHLERGPEDYEESRKAYSSRGKLLRTLMDVVKQSVTSGPMQAVHVVWPAHYFAKDPGEDVRLEQPEERPARSQ